MKKISKDIFPEIFLEEIFKIILEVTKKRILKGEKDEKTLVIFYLDRLLEIFVVKNIVLKL